MPLFKKLMVSRALIKECLTLDFRQGARIPSRCFIPTPTGMVYQRLCDTGALVQEITKSLNQPVLCAGHVNYYYFEQGQSMIGENSCQTRLLVCTRSAYVGGDIVLRSTRSRADKSILCPCQGMVVVLSPFCAFDITPVESGSMIVAEIAVSIPGFDHLEMPAPADAGVRLFNSPHLLWPRHSSNVCFAFRLLRDARSGARVVEQLFIDGRWYTVLATPGGGRICVPADVVGSTHLEEVPFCDATPDIMRRVLAIEPVYDALAYTHRCTHGAVDVRCALESIVYGMFRSGAPPRRSSSPGPELLSPADRPSDPPGDGAAEACANKPLTGFLSKLRDN